MGGVRHAHFCPIGNESLGKFATKVRIFFYFLTFSCKKSEESFFSCDAQRGFCCIFAVVEGYDEV